MSKFFNIAAVVVWMVVIFLLSSVPGKEYPAAFFDYGIIAHFIEYAILAFLSSRLFEKKSFRVFAGIFIFCMLFGLSDELHQSLVPFRDVSNLDWVVDMVGSLFGISLGFIFFRKR